MSKHTNRARQQRDDGDGAGHGTARWVAACSEPPRHRFADREARLRALAGRWHELLRIQDERAADRSISEPDWDGGAPPRPGKRGAGRGLSWRELWEYAGLVKELLRVDLQIAREEGDPAFCPPRDDPWATPAEADRDREGRAIEAAEDDRRAALLGHLEAAADLRSDHRPAPHEPSIGEEGAPRPVPPDAGAAITPMPGRWPR